MPQEPIIYKNVFTISPAAIRAAAAKLPFTTHPAHVEDNDVILGSLDHETLPPHFFGTFILLEVPCFPSELEAELARRDPTLKLGTAPQLLAYLATHGLEGCPEEFSAFRGNGLGPNDRVTYGVGMNEGGPSEIWLYRPGEIESGDPEVQPRHLIKLGTTEQVFVVKFSQPATT